MSAPTNFRGFNSLNCHLNPHVVDAGVAGGTSPI